MGIEGRIKPGNKYRVLYRVSSSPKGNIIYILAVIDKIQIVFKYYNRTWRQWVYKIERIGIIKNWINHPFKGV
jgi:hypothetical protein